MELKEYLYLQRLTIKEFSDILDYSRVHISSIINGKSYASDKIARKIERVTGGEVTRSDLPKIPDDKRKRTKKEIENENL